MTHGGHSFQEESSFDKSRKPEMPGYNKWMRELVIEYALTHQHLSEKPMLLTCYERLSMTVFDQDVKA